MKSYSKHEWRRLHDDHTVYAQKREVERKAFNLIYESDELYARKIRANTNLKNPGYGFEIFDELPEGWRLGIHEHGCYRRGLRSLNDHSKYEWCENGPMYLGTDSLGCYRKNPNYRQSLVRRQA